MPIDVSEFVLQSTIQAHIQSVQQDAATRIPEIFPQMTATMQQQVATSLQSGGALATIPVMLAYLPNAQPKLPAIYLYEVPGGEEVRGDVIGNRLRSTAITSSSGTVTGQQTMVGIYARKAWQITCAAAVNITDLLVMVALVKHALIAAREGFGAEPNAYVEQMLSWSGWGPMANSAGDVIFPLQQTVTFAITTYESATSINTQIMTGTSPSHLTP